MADRPCPYLRGSPDTGQWCSLAETEHRMHDRLRENFDRAISFSWLLEDLADRMAAQCADETLVGELAALKERRTAWAES